MKWILLINWLIGYTMSKAGMVKCAPQNVQTLSSEQTQSKNRLGGDAMKRQNDEQITLINATKWPWQVAIFTLQDEQFEFRCGGSLVAKDVILTAAHCLKNPDVTPSMVKIIAGDIDIAFNDGEEQASFVSTLLIHPGYTGTLSSLYGNDLALLKLTRPVVITESVSTISLAQNDAGTITAPCLIAGWGISNENTSSSRLATTLSYSTVDILTNEVCNKKDNWDQLIKQSQMCAYSRGKSACLGDSGGPLVCIINNRFMQYGVTSWGSKSCDRKPSVYTRISYYYTWISESIAGLKT